MEHRALLFKGRSEEEERKERRKVEKWGGPKKTNWKE